MTNDKEQAKKAAYRKGHDCATRGEAPSKYIIGMRPYELTAFWKGVMDGLALKPWGGAK